MLAQCALHAQSTTTAPAAQQAVWHNTMHTVSLMYGLNGSSHPQLAKLNERFKASPANWRLHASAKPAKPASTQHLAALLEALRI
jgi:hypothetical protein